jgi:predicted transcriptional regulator
MSDITRTAAQVAALDVMKAKIFSAIAYAAISRGQAVYMRTDGKVDLADANGSGTDTFAGIALASVGAGEAVDILTEGLVGGFTVSSVNAFVDLYLSNTPGALATAAGSTSVKVGKVVCLSDRPTFTKVLAVHAGW